MSNQQTVTTPQTPKKENYAMKAIKDWAWRFKDNKTALVSFIIVFVIVAVSVFAQYLAPYDPTQGVLSQRLKPPTFSAPPGGGFPHILGTDQQGRDVFSRLLYGGKVSLSVAFIVVAIGGCFGTVMGLISGYFGGWVDFFIMRIVDVMASFPGLIIALTFVMVLGPGMRNLSIALLVIGWMIHARMARSQVLSVRESAMVESAHAIGASTPRILFSHLLPNVLAPLITVYVLEISHMILAEANMSFLGFGIQPPQSSWGLMIGEGRQYISNAWWLVVFPGLIIATTVMCLSLFGNWIREEFDPLSRKH